MDIGFGKESKAVMKNALDYLKDIKRTNKKIIAIKTELESIKEQKDGLRSVEMSERVKSSITYSDILDSLIVEEDELMKEYQEICFEWRKCRNYISKISNQDYSDVLRYKYLLGHRYRSWDAVSKKMHISKRNIFRIHNEALEDFRKVTGMI